MMFCWKIKYGPKEKMMNINDKINEKIMYLFFWYDLSAKIIKISNRNIKAILRKTRGEKWNKADCAKSKILEKSKELLINN